MVQFVSILGLYEPKNFTQENYAVYEEKRLAFEVSKVNLHTELLKVQESLQAILDALIVNIERHPRFNTPIFMTTAFEMGSVRRNVPFTGLLDSLQTLKETTGILLEPIRIKEIVENCISSFKNNEIEYGYNQIVGADFTGIVATARLLGVELDREFAPVIQQLNEIENKRLEPLRRQVRKCKADFTDAQLSSVSAVELAIARFAAIEKIRGLADDWVKKGNNEAAGIRGICGELQGGRGCSIEASGLDGIIHEYRTLKDMQAGGFADQQVKRLKEILVAHHGNSQMLLTKEFCEETMRPLREYAIAAALSLPAPVRASVAPVTPAAQAAINRAAASKAAMDRAAEASKSAIAEIAPGVVAPAGVSSDSAQVVNGEVAGVVAPPPSPSPPTPTPIVADPPVPSAPPSQVHEAFATSANIENVENSILKTALFKLEPFRVKPAVQPHIVAAQPHIEAFIELVKELIGKVDDADLERAINQNYALLSNPKSTLEDYTNAANTMRGHPSPKLGALGLIMIAIGTAVAIALGVGLVPVGVVSIVACAYTLFATTNRTDISKVTMDIGGAAVRGPSAD